MRVINRYINVNLFIKAWLAEMFYATKLIAYVACLLLATGMQIQDSRWMVIAIYLIPFIVACACAYRHR